MMTDRGSGPLSPRGVPRLLAGSGEPFALWWAGDEQLDAVLAASDATEAARLLVGVERVTRPVIRALARSMIGPGGVPVPGATADLLPMSVLLGVDAQAGDPGRLAADDVAAVLVAGTSPVAATRRAPVGVFAREAFQRLVVGYTRRRRRDLAIELLTDRTGVAEAFLRLLDEAADIAYLDAFETPTARLSGLVEHLEWVLAHYRVPSRRQPLAGARAWRGRSPIDLPSGLQVRVPWSRELLEAEAGAFRNCLGSYYGKVDIQRALIATVWEDETPLGAAQISPPGVLRVLLGIDDEEVDLEDRRRIVGALRQAGVLPTPVEPDPLTSAERILGRIACHAALLLSEELEPDSGSFEPGWTGRQYGDRTLELLDRYAGLLTSSEYERLRAGRTPDPVEGWSHVGAMLVAAGEDDPELGVLDGRAPFRRAARMISQGILRGTHQSAGLREVRDLELVIADPALPRWQRDAVTEVLAQHHA